MIALAAPYLVRKFLAGEPEQNETQEPLRRLQVQIPGRRGGGEVNTYLAELRVTGKSITKDKGASYSTSNGYLTALNAFLNWLVLHNRMAENPLLRGGQSIIEKLNPEEDRRYVRRALKLEEFYKLLESAAKGPPIQTISGTDRRVLYLLAAYTGYRRWEVGSVLPSNFDLGDTPKLTVEIGNSKRRKSDEIPLRQDAAQILRDWFAARGALDPNKPVLPVGKRRTAKMMRLDLERAGIPYIDAKGRHADFHGLRKTLATNAKTAMIPVATTQKLMRHSTPELTINTYTDVEERELAEAVERLPPPVRPEPEEGSGAGASPAAGAA